MSRSSIKILSYKLAKELKDAGFPMGWGGRCGKRHNHIKDQENCVYVNQLTLEELIDACGDGFKHLHRGLTGKSWSAWGKIENVSRAKDPKTAVAKLFIKLNKK